MKLVLSFCAFCICFFSAQAQIVVNVSGIVLDSASKKAIPSATVTFLNPDDSTRSIVVFSTESGVFSADLNRETAYLMSIRVVGYNPYNKSLSFSFTDSATFNLGNVILSANSKQLDGAVITAKKEWMELKPDKKVFNTSAMATASGGTATDVLKNIPSVEISIDGNVSLRGSANVTVFINGKQSSMTGANRQAVLEQIPASSIDYVEIISNPGSRYDAEGMSGIINIVLKKTKSQGFNGSVTAGIGTRRKYNGGFLVNWGREKVNLSISYNYRYERKFSYGDGTRTSFFGDSSAFLESRNDGFSVTPTHVIRTTLDFFPVKKTAVSVSTTVNKKGGYRKEDNLYNYYDPSDLYKTDNRSAFDDNSGNSVDAGLYIKKDLKNKGNYLTGDFNFSSGVNDRISNYFHQYYENYPFSSRTGFQQQNNYASDINRVLTAAVDYVSLFKHKKYNELKFESGVKNTYRFVENDYYFENFDSIINVYKPDLGLNNIFRYAENVAAAYAQISGKIDKTSIQVGLRVENTVSKPTLVSAAPLKSRNYTSFFPSIFLTRSLSNTLNSRLSYSRRLNRPGIGQLNPFVEFSDPNTLRVGNPNLIPEFIDAFELGADKSFKKTTFVVTGYLRKISNQFGRILTTDSSLKALVTFTNLNAGYNYGVEGIANFRGTAKISGTAGVNIYASRLNASNVQENLSNKGMNFSINGTLNYNFTKNYGLQFSGRYKNPFPIAQGFIKPMYALDIAFRATVMKGAGNFVLNISDLFNTQYFGIETSGLNFEQEVYRKRESRILNATFTWKFGSQPNRQPLKQKDPNSGNRPENMDVF